ncbi:hypothetical protein B0H11DRAFT_2210381 [Mycena galericulata]|nr:hypothetical protein B0H11DRAFT_2210381 [Mycena galericulata]
MQHIADTETIKKESTRVTRSQLVIGGKVARWVTVECLCAVRIAAPEIIAFSDYFIITLLHRYVTLNLSYLRHPSSGEFLFQVTHPPEYSLYRSNSYETRWWKGVHVHPLPSSGIHPFTASPVPARILPVVLRKVAELLLH